ncbi:MAG: hypothetical protein K2X00_20285 [Nitrospiraceae bacterium]|nr:hypothetical protein [Nitrospiraceae bacterium]
MNRRNLLLASLTLPLLVAGCGRGKSLRIKQTVIVKTPEGVKTGSAVCEIATFETYDLMYDSWGSDAKLKGEATIVDLPNGKVLLTLLYPEPVIAIMQTLDRAFPRNSDPIASAERIAARRDAVSSVAIAREHYPILVTFRNPADPMSVETVDPLKLTEKFGLGYELVEINVQATDEPVTQKIEMRFTWLNRLYQYRRDRTNPFSSKLPAAIRYLRSK